MKITTLIVGLAGLMLATQASAAEKLTYLFPAPATVPAFAPFQIAKANGYYKAEGLDVTFSVGKGGADVAKQVGVGNVDLGGGLGDTPIIVRANGLPVKGVALLGGHALHEIMARKDSGIKSFADLKGKKIGVAAFQDTSYFNLLAVLASQGMTKADVNIEAVGFGGMVPLMVSGELQAICGAPEWAVLLEQAGTPVEVFQINRAFPAMAQAILASDSIIKQRPKAVAGFVHATLKAVREIMADPAAAAKAFVAAVPQQADKEKMVEAVLRHYAEAVYPVEPGRTLGAFDPKQVATVQQFYLKNDIVRKAVPIDELYTNQLVESGDNSSSR